MSVTGGAAGLGSARVPRAGYGVPPQRTFSTAYYSQELQRWSKSSRSRGRARQHATSVRSPDTLLHAF
jgi:hypothetical protein